jgi:hypothetical protein
VVYSLQPAYHLMRKESSEMSEQAVAQGKKTVFPPRFTASMLIGRLLWGIAMLALLAVLIVRLTHLSISSGLLQPVLNLFQIAMLLAYLVGYLIPVARRWYIAPTPPEQWTPERRASTIWEAWATHLPLALLGLVLLNAGIGVLFDITTGHQPRALQYFVALVFLGAGILLFLRSTALGLPMGTTTWGRRWFYGCMALLLVPLDVILAVQAFGAFSAGVALSVLGMLVFAYSMGVSAFTSYGVRALLKASKYQSLSGIVSAGELEAFKEPPPALNWWLRHRSLVIAWLPPFIGLVIFVIIGSVVGRVIGGTPGTAPSGAGQHVGPPGNTLGTLLLILVPSLLFYRRQYRGLKLQAQLLRAQTWGTRPVTPERRRALARKIAPAFSVTVLLAALICGALMEVVDKTGVVSGLQFWLNSVAGPIRTDDAGGDVLRWLASALPDLLVYLAAATGALIHAEVFFSRPFKQGQFAWRSKMLAAEEERRTRVWVTLLQRMEGKGTAARESADFALEHEALTPFPLELSDSMLMLIYELSKERVERYKQVSLHPFGALGHLRAIGAAILLALPGFLLNHLNIVGQFFTGK